MQQELARPGDENAIIDTAIVDADLEISIEPSLATHFSDGKVSVSLKYYTSKCECFSEWQHKELKAFSSVIDKLSARTQEQVTSSTNTCRCHRNRPERERFSRPNDLSPDLIFYDIHVTAKARVHGFFVGPVFFLVWLDRKHECFASAS
ncbi:MAG6450 family protein [Rhodomicrobium vannielii]|uniref:MAG6450 family protein n=1 Tax=Rhodomicrobium vannielii TaxID=1069 RepID=UPI003CCF5E82